jgi:DNA polymerase elongation subunit (family B)
LADWDVASYYPNIILAQRLAPKHLGPDFLRVFEQIVDRRIAAKRSGDKVTADTLKITINGAFGKLGSKYSFLYSPELLIQTTLTGQLALLMLIERMEGAGIKVVSANTDGIVLYGPRSFESAMEVVAWDWMLDTSFELERTDYRALASRDVNNYLAVKLDGSVKGKGVFAPAGLAKNPDCQIIYEAAAKRIATGVSIEQTIRNCRDVTKFVTVRRVTGGAVWNGENLGKAVRYYYATSVPSEQTINYAKNGNKVPKSQGCRPLMELPQELPSDIDYAVYELEAERLLCEVGYL